MLLLLRTQTVTTTTAGTTITLTGLSPSSNYSVSVRAYDAAGNYSTISNTVNFTTNALSVVTFVGWGNPI